MTWELFSKSFYFLLNRHLFLDRKFENYSWIIYCCHFIAECILKKYLQKRPFESYFNVLHSDYNIKYYRYLSNMYYKDEFIKNQKQPQFILHNLIMSQEVSWWFNIFEMQHSDPKNRNLIKNCIVVYCMSQ